MAAHVSLVSLFLVLSAEGVRVGTDSSLLVPSGITSSSGSLSSAAGSLRPDFSHVALTYLGRERVLAFDQWTGEHALWSLERNEVSKCDAFMWPPLSAGRWAALRYHEFVFVGFTQLIALDPSTGKLTLTECDDSAFLPRCHGEALRCSPLFEHTLAPLQPGHAAIHELTYLGRELLLHYDRTSGRYAVLRFEGCALNATGALPRRCALSAPLARGTLPAGAQHTYLGSGWLLAYHPHGAASYEVLRIRRAAEPSPTGARANGTASAANGGAAVGIQLERVSAGTWPVAGSWSDDGRRHRLLGLHEGMLIEYDKETAAFRLLDLQPDGVETATEATSVAEPSSAESEAAPLTVTREGSLRYVVLNAGVMPSSATSGCGKHTDSFTCLRASLEGKACGWCQANGRCVRGDAWGPCRRSACVGGPVACGVWHSPAGTLAAIDPGHALAAVDAASALQNVTATAAPDATPYTQLPYTHLMDKTSCLKCSGGGAELRGGAMAALAACGECAVLQASLGQGAILPADALGQDGLLSHLAQFVLQTLRTEACARVLSTGCVLLGGSSAFRLQAATAAPIQPPLVPAASAAQVEKKDALTNGTNGTNGTGSSAANATEAEEEVPPTFAFSLQVRLGSTADLAAAASTAVPYAVLHLVIAAPSAGFDDQTDDEGSGAEVGTLLLTSVALSLAPSNASDVALALPPVEALESPIMAPLQLDARAFLAYATPAFDPTASRRGITPLAGALPAASAALAFGTHELIYLGYDAILDYVPASAAMAVHQLDAGAAAAGGSPVLTPPLATTTWTARYRRFAYLGFDWWLEYDPSDGAYGLHRCGHERWRVGLPPLCSPLCPTALGCGTLSDLSGDVTLLYLGHDALLSVHRLTGAYALLRLERSPARLVAPPAAVATDGSPAADLTMATLSLGSAANAAAPAADLEAAEGAGLRGTLPALAGREIAYLGNELLLALDDDSSSVGGASGGGNALFFLLCRNASEVAARRSPLRAVLAAPPTTSAALVSTFTSGAAAASARSQLPSGRRLIGLGGGRVLRLAPRAASGFAYEMFECAPSPCVADDCLGPAAPTGGEVKCASVGAGEVARAAGSLSDGSAPTAAQRGLTGRLTSLEAKATPPDELNAARRPTVSGAVSGALVADGAGAAPVTALGGSSSNGVPLPLSAVLPPRTHGGGVVGRTQWLRLDGDGSALGGDALFEYESATGGVRLRQLTMPSDVPITTPASAGATLASGALGGAAAGTSCDSLPLLPYLTAPWAFPAHRLHSLGRAMVLDVDPLTAIFRVWKCDGALPAAILPTVGDAPITPPITTKARPSVPCVAIDNGVWPPLASHEQAVWLGDALGDAVLLFAPLSGAYEVWPVRQIAARVMPRPGQRALAAGVWAELLGCTLHHAGGSTLVALRPNTGEYSLLILDSSALVGARAVDAAPSVATPPAAATAPLRRIGGFKAAATPLSPSPPPATEDFGSSARPLGTPAPPLEYGLLSQGSLADVPAVTLDDPATAAAAAAAAAAAPSAAAAAAAASTAASKRPCAFAYHDATYLGSDLLLSVEPASGRYCVLRLTRERPSLPALAHVGGGDLRHTPCDARSCTECSTQPGCGWCAVTGTCVQGDERGACGGGCEEHWLYGYCSADWPCAHHSTCDDCLAHEMCGWCAATRTCMAGSDVQPLHLHCPAGYRYQQCSGRIGNATVVAV
jgi:hypothetical protein